MPAKIDTSRTIQVSGGILYFHDSMIPLTNISKISAFKYRKKNYAWTISFGISALMAILVSAIFYVGNAEDISRGLAITGAALTALCIFSIDTNKNYEFGLNITTNGGTNDFIISYDKDFSLKAINLIREAVNNKNNHHSYTINMEKLAIYEGDKFDNINGSINIATRGSNVLHNSPCSGLELKKKHSTSSDNSATR